VRQAVLQIRVFRTGDVDQPLPDEDAVVDIMARALVGD
jgi:shikimate dehydrogenase